MYVRFGGAERDGIGDGTADGRTTDFVASEF